MIEQGRDYTKRPLTDTEKRQNLVFTFVSAYARMYELKIDPDLYEAEIDELRKLDNWWHKILTEKQRDKIRNVVLSYGSGDPGVPQHKEESMLLLLCTYARMVELRSIDKRRRTRAQHEESRRLEFEWGNLPESLQFDIVKWVKAYFQHYDHPLLLEMI